jgi:phosphopantothenate synthetase
MVSLAKEMKDLPKEELRKIVDGFNNDENLAMSVRIIMDHLDAIASDVGSLRKEKNKTTVNVQ